MKQNLSRILYSMPLISFLVGCTFYYIVLNPGDRVGYTVVEMAFKDPAVFILGFSGLVAGTVLDRMGGLKTEHIARKTEKAAVLWLTVGLLASALAAGFQPIKLFNLIIEGKFLIIQPLLIILYSLIMPLGKDFMSRVSLKSVLKGILLLAMASSPAYIFYAGIKEGQSMQNYVSGLAVFAIAFTFYIILNTKFFERKPILRG